MADLVALRAALTRMGFGPACATFITDTQGMNNLEEFRLLDDDAAQNLCKVIHLLSGVWTNRTITPGSPAWDFLATTLVLLHPSGLNYRIFRSPAPTECT